ncbi:MAG: AAA family ATPase [Alphaproteobacteria bacterium]
MLLTLAISGYRSLREFCVPLERLTVVTGANGSGKSSFYRALRLLAESAQGRVIGSLAAEGGLSSTLWAGPEVITQNMRSGAVPVQGTAKREGSVAVKLGFAGEDYGYSIDLGLPVRMGTSRFNNDPEIKAEAVWAGDYFSRRSAFATRRGPSVEILGEDGRRRNVSTSLAAWDSMMTHAADPAGAPELLQLRERMRGWRFYDHFRTDADSPARRARIGTRTPALSADGSDLAAALQTIMEIGDPRALADGIDDAFPGSRIEIEEAGGLFSVTMRQPGLLRPLQVAELSDGTLRYLLLLAALLTPRPPELIVLNEPETSLHPDLLAPLGRLILSVSDRTQVIVVSHAAALVDALARDRNAGLIRLEKQLGETVAPDHDSPQWAWPDR